MSSKKIPVECYTRIVGYFRPTSEVNKGKAEEIAMRRPFDANKYLAEKERENVAVSI